MVRDRHAKITRDAGAYGANGAFRVLRTIFLYTIASKRRPDGTPWLLCNPVDVLTRLKLWNPEKRKQRFVPSAKLEDWFDAVEAVDKKEFRAAHQIKALLYLMIFLGFRVSEAKSIPLDQVSFDPPALRLKETKNDDEHFVPLPPFLAGVLKELADDAKAARSKYLFFSGESESGHLHDPRKVIRAVKDMAKIQFSPHDLRRTFVTMLNALEPAPSYYTIKRLMNHRQSQSDVTAGNIQHEETRLRDTVTRLEAHILKLAGRAPSGRKLKKRASRTT